MFRSTNSRRKMLFKAMPVKGLYGQMLYDPSKDPLWPEIQVLLSAPSWTVAAVHVAARCAERVSFP